MIGVNTAGRTALPVVGVKVTSSNGESTDVYALLDSGSDRTFCSPDLLESLNTEGKPTTFTVSTLNDGKEVDAREISLTVSALNNDNATSTEHTHLPEVYAIDTFPTLKNSIATSDDVSQYSHLKNIPLPDVNAQYSL